MGEYTKNLQLYKVDTVEDANNTFNIETMLNNNWDKIDEKLEKLPVQNGGLYINSETTDEDKAEALTALEGLGVSKKEHTHSNYVTTTAMNNAIAAAIGNAIAASY